MPSITELLGRRRVLPQGDDFDSILARLDADPDSAIHTTDDDPDVMQATRDRAFVDDAATRELGKSRLRRSLEGTVEGGKQMFNLATGRHEMQAQAGEWLGSKVRALRNRGGAAVQSNVPLAQAIGFVEGASETLPRVLSPLNILSAGETGPALTALNVADALVGVKEGSEALAEGDTAGGAVGLGTSALAALLGAHGLASARAPRPRPVAEPTVRPHDFSPRSRAMPDMPADLPPGVLEGEVIAGPAEAPWMGRPNRQRQLGSRDPNAPLITPPPDVDPLAGYREGLPAAGEMPPGQAPPQGLSIRDALSDLPAPTRATSIASRGVGAPLPDELVDALAPPAAGGPQTIDLPRPVDLMGRQVRQLTVDGDTVTAMLPDGEGVSFPRAAAEELGLPVPPARGQGRGLLEALQARRAAALPESAAPGEISQPAPGRARRLPAGSPEAMEAQPYNLTPEQETQLADIMRMLREDGLGGPPTPDGGPAGPAPGGGDDPMAELARLFSEGGDELPPAREFQPQPAGTGLELLDPDAGLGNNASGESGASMEAMSRLRDMSARGEQFVVLDRGGRERPLIGADAVDYQPSRGETFAKRRADGSYEVLTDNGGRVPPQQQPQVQEVARAAGAENVDDDVMGWINEQLGIAGAEKPPDELVRAAFTDQLTGLPNRRGLSELEQRGGGDPLFAALDVRNLKAVNDLMGQEHGDRLIQLVGEELGRSLRKGDVPSRHGGDEFLLALQGVNEEGRPVVQQKVMDAMDRALERFGTRQVRDFPLGARMGFGASRDDAFAEMTRLKGQEKGAKYRTLEDEEASVALPRPPANPQAGIRYEMPASTIDVDPSRFQYRRSTNKAGVSAERAIDEPFDPKLAGNVIVWKDPADGKTYVVNGHHRLDSAKRSGADVGAIYIDAPDAASARAAGAVLNLREGNSSMLDAVNFIRDSGMPPDGLRNFGITPRTTIGRDAPAIASLSDPIRERWAAGEMGDDLAATLGRANLPPEQQQAVAQMLDRASKQGKRPTASMLQNVIEQVQRAESVNMAGQGSQSNIFDVLGEDQWASTAMQRAELVDFVREQLGKDKRLFGFVAKGERAGRIGEAGAGSIDTARAGELAGEAKKVGAVFDTLERSRGPLSDALNNAAQRIMAGENPNAVRQQLLGEVRAGVEAELRAPAREVGPGGPAPVGRSAAPEADPNGLRAGEGAGRGEQQPALPGEVGRVRDIENAQPEFPIPYSLEREAAPDAPTKQRSFVDELNDLALPEPPQAFARGEIMDRIADVGGARQASTYDELPSNVRDFLTKRLKYSVDDIDAMTPEQATKIGRDQTFNPKLTERNAEAEARYGKDLEDLSAVFESGYGERVRSAAANRRASRQGGVPTPEETRAALQRQAPMRAEAEAELQVVRAREGEPKAKATPSQMREKQVLGVHRARDIGKAIEGRDFDEAARLIGEQAEDWNNARLREGTGGEREPGKSRNGEYLASDFGAIHKFLFTPEGRASLGQGARDLGKLSVALAKNPAVRGIVGGVVGASTGDDIDEQIQRGIAGMVIGAGTPGGIRALGEAFDHYKRTGKVMRKSPRVANNDIGYWRAFIAPSTLERTVPDVFNSAREVLRDLHEYRSANPNASREVSSAAEKIARGEIVTMMRREAQIAESRGQKNLAARIGSTADAISGKLTSGQRAVKRGLEHTGTKKKASGREVENVMQRQIYRVTLGYALDSAAKNLFQPSLALLHVSPRNMIRGYRAAMTDAGKEFYKGLELELSRASEGEGELTELLGLGKRGGVTDSGRFMTATDNFNRRAVLMAHLAEQGQLDAAIAGEAPQSAIQAAERVMRLTQGEPGPLSGSPVFRGPVMGSLKPFTKYPNLAIENFLDAFQGEAKYPKQAVLGMLALGLSGSALGLNLWDVLIGGARPLGVDLGNPRRVQAPPAIGAAARVGQYISGEKRVFGDFIPSSMRPDDVLQSDLATLVAGRYPVKAADTLMNLKGSKDPSGDLLSLLGLTTSERAEKRATRQDAYEFKEERRQEATSTSRRLRREYDRALRRGDSADDLKVLEDLLTPRQEADVRRNLTRGDLERIRRQVPKKDREAFDELFGAALADEKQELQRRGAQ